MTKVIIFTETEAAKIAKMPIERMTTDQIIKALKK